MATNKIDYCKLLGFESVDGLISAVVDFQDEAVARHIFARGESVHQTGHGHDQDATAQQRQMIERVEAI